MTDTSQLAILRQEHELAIALLASLQEQVRALASSSSASPSSADCQAQLSQLRSAMLLHFRIEEEGLYPDVKRIAAEGAPKVDILTAFFGDESDDDLKAHTLLRARLREAAGVFDQAQAGGMSRELASRLGNTLEMTHDLLNRHASKETTLIFPLVERLLGAAQRAAVEEKMWSLRQSAKAHLGQSPDRGGCV
jgi:hemerythrin-like domain-containing protein